MPAQAACRPTGNLPAEKTRFVGRQREISEVRRLLGHTRLLTLTGMGGVGKTRLALRVARETARVFPDGVWFVDLAPVRDERLLVPTVMRTLGLADQSARPPLDRLTEFLAGKRLLLVLDNCEHLPEACAALLGVLLRTVPAVRVLATSRETLHVNGERVFVVPPLSLPHDGRRLTRADLERSEAVRLLVDRASAVPDLVDTEETRRTILRICRRLDGVPLSIELAAAQLRWTSPAQLVRRLDDRFRLLAAGDGRLPSRQRTLQAAIDWSHDLCTAEESALWARLSVFSGDFDLRAVEAVCGGDPVSDETMFDLLVGLIDKSIVVRADRGAHVRFRLLETIREYGRALLAASGQEQVFRARYREHYRRITADAERSLYGPDRGRWFERLSLEHANVQAVLEDLLAVPGEERTVLEMVTANWAFWIHYGAMGEGRHWLDRALARDPAATPARATALWVDARFAVLQGDIEIGSALARECRCVAARTGDASAGVHATEILGLAALFSGDWPAAETLLERALRGSRRTGEPSGLTVLMLYELAWVTAILGETDRALALGERSLRINDEHHGSWRYLPLWVLGFTRFQRGELAEARALVRESLRLQRAVDELYNTTRGLEVLAWTAALEGRHRYAARILGAAHGLRRQLETSVVRLPPLRDFHDACVARLRAALGDTALAEAFERGAELTTDQAIAAALEEDADGAARPLEAAASFASLTPRERQVADLVVRGLTNKDIAAELMIAQRTVEGHVEHILAKLGCSCRTQLAGRAGPANRGRGGRSGAWRRPSACD